MNDGISKNAKEYIFDMATGEINIMKAQSPIAYRTMKNYAVVHEFIDEHPEKRRNQWEAISASPYAYFNPKFAKKRIKAWSYDMNSAYAFAMLNDMPDTRVPYKDGIVGEGEIGFDMGVNHLGGYSCLMRHPGEYATYIFPLMKSPFKNFVNIYYNKKKNAKDEIEKLKAKAILVDAVGSLQNHNPFLRAAIVNYANEYMSNLTNEDTVLINTDGMVSATPRPDLDIGTELGQFKCEHENEDFAAKGRTSYQWNRDTPKYGGIPHEWFKKGWDILKDPLPIPNNRYYFDEKEFCIKEDAEYGNNQKALGK